MTRIMKSILSSSLVVAMLLSSCAQNDTEQSSSSVGGASSTGTPPVVDAENPSWKIDTSPVELEWFVGYDWATHTFNPEANVFDKFTLEETGVTINWSSGNLEKLNVLISTDSLPDIVTYDVISTERLNMEDNGLYTH